MQNILLIVTTVLLISSVTLADFNLKLSNEFSREQNQSFLNHNLETNLKLKLPAEVTSPGGMGDLYKGLWLIGVMIDLSLPLGEDFKNFAGTGFSGHLFASYVIASAFMLELGVGYVAFGEQKEEFTDGSITQCYTQIPVSLAALYMFSTGGKLIPYLGLALSVFFQSYKYTQEYTTFNEKFEESDNETKFGVAPMLGLMFYVSAAILINVRAQWVNVFHEAQEGGSNINYIGFLVGASFVLGGQ